MKFVKSALSVIVSSAALFAAVGAQASVITIDNPAADTKITQGKPLSYEFDLTAEGFLAGVTDYTSGILQVRFTDVSASESGMLTIGNQSLNFSDIANKTVDLDAPNGSIFDIVLDAASLADLNADGQIAMQVTSSQGDFYFSDASLTLQQTTNQVPEPLSLALVGAGLLGMGAVRRRRNVK